MDGGIDGRLAAQLLGEIEGCRLLRLGRKLVGAAVAGEMKGPPGRRGKGRAGRAAELRHGLRVKRFVRLHKRRRRPTFGTVLLKQQPTAAMGVVFNLEKRVGIDATKTQEHAQELPALAGTPGGRHLGQLGLVDPGDMAGALGHHIIILMD